MSGFTNAISHLTDKNGDRILPVIEDMQQRENGILIVNLACDDDDARINAYVAGQYADIAAAGIIALAEACRCRDILIYRGDANADAMLAGVNARTDIPAAALSGPASPVLRDETALYTVIDTGVIRVNRAEQDYRRTFLSYGYQGRPTLVIDGETAYQAGRLHSDPDAAITKLVAVNTIIMEINVGASVAEALKGYDINSPVLIGGPCGRMISEQSLKDTYIGLKYEYDSIRTFTDKDCIIDELSRLYLSIRELSCAKCVMCREGSWQLCAIFSDIAAGRANRDDIALIEDICPIIHAGALCSFGKNMVMPALTAATECRGIFEKHIIGKNCPAGRCAGFIKYIVDPSLCTGCGDCIDSCPEEAIEGKPGFIHIIDEKLCDKCGDCVSSCPEKAIKRDAGSIRTPKKPVKAGRFTGN